MKKLLKIFKWVLISCISLVAITILSVIYYVETSIGDVMSEEQQEYVLNELESAPVLPDSFHITVQKFYPEHYNSSFWSSIFNTVISNTNVTCRCRDIYLHPGYVENTPRLWQQIIAAWLEDETNQKRCFEFDLYLTDYYNGNKGVLAACDYYYSKTINQLTEPEIIEIILFSKNPALYNPRKNRTRLDQEVNKVLIKE